MTTALSILFFSLLGSSSFLMESPHQLSNSFLRHLERGLNFEELDPGIIRLVPVEESRFNGSDEYRAAMTMSIVEGNPYKIDIEGWYDYLRTRKPIWNCELKAVLKKGGTAYSLEAERLCENVSPRKIPGGDQFIPTGSLLIPGGDQFIPGGDQFIPGGDQFSKSKGAHYFLLISIESKLKILPAIIPLSIE